MKEIYNRRSIRKFLSKEVEQEKIEQLLRAAMQAPSAGNQQPWEYIVVKDKVLLKELSEVSLYSKLAAGSAVTIVMLANSDKLLIPTAWEQDMGAAAQNILLEAVTQELGAVWLGVATDNKVADNVRDLFQLPENIKPFALISIGYPDGQENTFIDRYDANSVHFEKYN